MIYSFDTKKVSSLIMSETQSILNLAEVLGPIPTDAIISRTLHQNGALRVILFGFAPGQELSEHTSPMAATLQLISGHATVTLGAESHEFGPGAWAQMAPKLPHSIRAHNEPVVMLLTMVKSDPL